MLKTLCIILLLISIQFNLDAQVNIVKDSRIDSKIKSKAGKTMPGFRIQIAFDSNKDAVDDVRKKFVGLYPKIDTYLTFEAPNFNLRVGDFRNQIEAEKFREKIAGEFPISIIHKENINLPRVEQNEAKSASSPEPSN